MFRQSVFCLKFTIFPQSRTEKNTRKIPLLRYRGEKGAYMRTGLKKQEKITEIWFDEKDPTIYVRTHNTDLKKS